MDPGLPTDEQATQEMDFLSTSGSVAMGDGETSATVSVTILPVSSVCYGDTLQQV